MGADDGLMVILGLALSNSLIALAGALLAQYQGFADVQMGIGMVVWGLASVIIGEALVGTRRLGYAITGSVMGSILFRLLVAVALRWGLSPNDLKLITAAFVFLALILPKMMDTARVRAAEVGPCLRFAVFARLSTPERPNEVRALQGVDLTLHDGSFTIIIGTNGSGKSTMLNAVAGSFFVDDGDLRIAEEPMSPAGPNTSGRN